MFRTPGDGPHPLLGDQAKVFGRFIGTWDAEYTEFSKDRKETHSSGELIFGWLMNGRAMQDLFIIYPSAAHRWVYQHEPALFRPGVRNMALDVY